MPAAMPLDVFAAVRPVLVALGGWWATATIHFGRRPPNGAMPPYVVGNVDETKPAVVESDGAAVQEFALEIVGRSVGPDDAAAMNEQFPRFDAPASNPSGGIDLTPCKVTLVTPDGSRLKVLNELVEGNDQYAVGRRWLLTVASTPGD